MTGRRTEPASARRLAEALSAGVRPISRDLIALLALTAAWLGLSLWLPAFWQAWKQSLLTAIGDSGAPMLDDVALFTSLAAVRGLLLVLLAVLVLITLASLVGWLVQGGFRFRSHLARGRVHVSSTAGLGTLWLCVKAAVMTAAFASVAHHALRAVVATPSADVAYSQRVLSAIVDAFVSRVGVVLALMVIADLIVQRLLWRRSLRMTRDELKRELRDAEGDLILRTELRDRQRQTAWEP